MFQWARGDHVNWVNRANSANVHQHSTEATLQVKVAHFIVQHPTHYLLLVHGWRQAVHVVL